MNATHNVHCVQNGRYLPKNWYQTTKQGPLCCTLFLVKIFKPLFSLSVLLSFSKFPGSQKIFGLLNWCCSAAGTSSFVNRRTKKLPTAGQHPPCFWNFCLLTKKRISMAFMRWFFLMAITMGIGVMVSGCAGKTTRPDASAADPVVVDRCLWHRKNPSQSQFTGQLRQSRWTCPVRRPGKSTDPLWTPITLNWSVPGTAQKFWPKFRVSFDRCWRPPNQPRVVTLMAHDEPVIHCC